jgi:hypothetical protein
LKYYTQIIKNLEFIPKNPREEKSEKERKKLIFLKNGKHPQYFS